MASATHGISSVVPLMYVVLNVLPVQETIQETVTALELEFEWCIFASMKCVTIGLMITPQLPVAPFTNMV